MGLRSFFQRKASAALSAVPSSANGTQDDVLSPADLADLEAAWADLAAAEESEMTHGPALDRRPGSGQGGSGNAAGVPGSGGPAAKVAATGPALPGGQPGRCRSRTPGVHPS
ncbi:MAG: hypothetical protein JWO49_1280 [Arthrobacter sp.]|nr:hypothetical protein [Arthrobacter sp.]